MIIALDNTAYLEDYSKNNILDTCSREQMNFMVPITGLYEVAIKVRALSIAEPFYREIMGLQFGLRDQKRNWLFLRVGGSAGMVVLQEDRGEWPRQHFAFAVKDFELERAAALLKEKGISIEGPVFHDWMPGRSVYFADPDGHDLELFALSDDSDRGENRP